MKTALFLLGILADHFAEEVKRCDKMDSNWHKKLEEFQATVPPPEKRTVEQWEKLVELSEERYYAMAALSHTRSANNRLQSLVEAIKENSA